jgi:PAS domain S-box-containing protein
MALPTNASVTSGTSDDEVRSVQMIVGIGVSAEGLEALERLFANTPERTGIAFVIVMSQGRPRPSLLVDQIAKCTALRVRRAEDGLRVEPAHVYVAPANSLLTLERGTLRVTLPPHNAAGGAVDTFFRSLAEDAEEDAAGILLSAAESDGIVGLRALKEHGGLTLAQATGTLDGGGLPQSAAAAGLVDVVCSIEEMPTRLLSRLGQRGPGGRARARVYFRDITERRQAEGALRRGDEQLRILIENVNAGVALIDEAGRFSLFNAQFLRMFGLSPGSDVRNVNDQNWADWQVLDEAGRLLHLDEHPVRKAVLTGQPVRNQLVGVRCPQARDIVWMLVSAETLSDTRGRVMNVICTYSDVTDRRRVELALGESEATLRGILNAAKESIWLFRTDGLCLMGNDTALERWGRPPETVIGQKILDVLPPDLARTRMARLQEAAAVGPIEFEDCRAGMLFEHRFCPVRGPDGTVERIVVFSRDVTERRRSEQALWQSEQRFKSVLENSLDCIYRFNLQTGRYEYISPAAERTTGYSPEELMAQDAPTALAMIHPEDLPGMLAGLAHADRTGEARLAYRQRAKDGDYRWISNHLSVTQDGSGRPLYRDGSLRDITQSKHQEAQLERLTRLYAVLSRVNEVIVRTHDATELYRQVCRIVAEEGHWPLVWIGLVQGQRVRPVAWSGRASAYLDGIRVEVDGKYGQGPTGTSVREDRPVVNDDFDTNPSTQPWGAAAISHGLRASASFPLRHQQRVIGTFALYANEPGTFDPQQVRLIDALSADLSYALDKMVQEQELRQSEQSLREADQRKNEFLAVLSHELRNPLAPVRNSLCILDRPDATDEQVRRAKSVIGRQIGQMARLVDDLLDVTRITRGKIRVQRAPLELTALLERTAEDHRSEFMAAGVELELHTGEKRVWVEADAARIAQAVGNLLQNAAKFTGRGGRVSLSLEEDPERRMAVIRVRDTGIGIEPELLRRLFEPFSQADSSLDRSQGGLGLGLALVKGFAELHGGTVEARSEGLGRGAEFALSLPLDENATGERHHSSRPPPADSRRVLIIEDNVDAADSLRDLLELGAHTVRVAYDGPSGIEMARTFRPEVVLCDIGLPGMDGYSVARTLRADPELGSAWLVALTGYALPEDLTRAEEAGFRDHLAKPPDLEKLGRILGRG